MQRNTADFYSYGEIGDVLGVAPETVRQIERKALIKLRKVLTRRGVSASHLFDSVRRPSRKP
jgi:DNA-directed RNA polymerase sigma subunit (sigma70/sigma32)